MKKPFYKRIWFIVLVVIFVLGGVGAAFGTDDVKEEEPVQETTQETNQNADEEIKEEVKEEIEEDPEYKMNQNVKVGDMVYNIKSKKIKTSVGPSVLPTNAKDKFVVVKVKVKNNGSKSITVDSSFFKLLLDDKTFEADSMASMSANQNENGNIKNSFFFDELNPDSTMTGYVAFDVSSSVAKSKKLKIQVQTGYWGTQSEVINLK